VTTGHPAARNTARARPASTKMGAMAVFVSYSSKDEASVQKLISAFRLADEDVWWDEEIGGGESWWRTILERIRGSDVFVFALSQNSLYSKSCQAELGYARELGKPILPVQISRVESVRVNPFAATQVIDFRTPSVDTGIRLIADVRRAGRRPLPDPLPPEPPMPYAYMMRLQLDVSSPQLFPQRQLQLLVELKERLNEDGADASVRADIARLLYALRDRSDTTDETRAEIDAMVESLDLKRPDDRRFSRKWILAGASLLVAVVVAVVVVFVTMPGRPGSTLITPSKVAAALLSNEDVDAIVGKSDMHGDPIEVTPPHDLPQGVRPPQCLGAMYNAAEPVYRDSGYSDPRNQALRSDTTAAFVDQTAIRFPSPPQASAFVRASADRWKTCSNQPVEVTETNGTTSTWAFTPVVDKGSQIVDKETLQGGGKDYVCQHVLRAESNVVIEVHTCDDHISDESVLIAEKMTAQVTDLTRKA
jgi:hypothetical protein